MNSSGLAVGGALYDLLLLTRLVLYGSSSDRCVLVHCRGAYHVLAGFSFFLHGVSTVNHLALPAGSKTLPARDFYVGWQPCDTYRN